MKIWRYKKYDFIKGYLPLGIEIKPKEVYALEAPDEDYELVTDQVYLDNFVAEKYEINELEGRKYKNLLSAKISNLTSMGIISVEEAENYGKLTAKVRAFLTEGYWHSAYYAHVTIVPDSTLEELHLQIKTYIKEYVNTRYPSQFNISDGS